MANKWSNTERDRWDEEHRIRRSREFGSGYQQDRQSQHYQDYSSGQQQFDTGSNYRTDAEWRQEAAARRERLRTAAPSFDPQYQEENFAQPGTFYYGGEPQRRFGLTPSESPTDENFYPDAGPSARMPATPASYGGEIDRDAAYREMGRLEQDHERELERHRHRLFGRHRDHDGAYDHHDRGLFGRAREKMFGHSGKGPKGYTRSDDRIREDINDHLTRDWDVDATHIDVVVVDCECTLNGTVSSRDQKRRAEDLAESVMGVKHVQNNLRVAPIDTALSSQDATGTMGTTAGSNRTLSRP